MKTLNEIEAAIAAANAIIPEWVEDTGKATHEFMSEQPLPCTLWETSYVWHGDRLYRVTVSPIKVIKYDLSPGASTPTVEFRDSDGRRARGSVDMYYASEEAAQAEAAHALATRDRVEANVQLIALLHNHAPALIECVKALDNLVGAGAQHEHTCDSAEHDEDGACIYCEARAALGKLK